MSRFPGSPEFPPNRRLKSYSKEKTEYGQNLEFVGIICYRREDDIGRIPGGRRARKTVCIHMSVDTPLKNKEIEDRTDCGRRTNFLNLSI